MLASLLLALAAAPASSGPPPVPADYELQWSAPVECPDATQIRDRIAALRGANVGGEGIAVITARITPDAGGYTLALTTSFAASTHARELHAAQCSELGESTAIVVAVALREGVAAAMADDEPPAAIAVPETVVPTTTAPTPQVTPRPVQPGSDASLVDEPIAGGSFETVPPPAAARPRIAPADPLLRMEGVGEIGALGAITGGARVVLGLEWPRARIELSGLYLAPRRRTLGDGRGASFQAGAVGVRGCWVPRAGALLLPLCAGLEAGTVRADNRGITPSKTLHTPWAGPSVGAGLSRAIGPVRLWLGVDAAVRVAGTDFRVGGDVVFRQWPVSLRWALGLEIPLGRRAAGQANKNPRVR